MERGGKEKMIFETDGYGTSCAWLAADNNWSIGDISLAGRRYTRPERSDLRRAVVEVTETLRSSTVRLRRRANHAA